MMEVKNLQSEVSCGEVDKIKTPFAHIIVGGTSENPYYSIMWYGSDGDLHIGYGSYCLEYVFKWLSEEFEIIEEQPTIEVQRWIPVAERLPDVWQSVLVARKAVHIEFVLSSGGWSGDEQYNYPAPVTHWMPLPDVPKEGDK